MKELQHNNHKWSSKFGFIMASVGSAVGLGNIWRFPNVVSSNGGAIFLLVYIVVLVVLGFTIMSAELAIGRYSGMSNIDSFKRGKKNWSFIGIMSIFTCFFIVSYYSVIGGWITKYIGGYLIGGGFVAGGNYGEVFGKFVANGVEPAVYNFAFLFLCMLVLAFGVKKGIEKISKVLMPALFVMLIFAAIVALTMPGAIEGVKFFFVPNFDNIEGGVFGVINAAMGQAFFSLSLGMGITFTYGSYLSKDSNIPKDSITVCGFDTLVAVLAGLAILPAVFSVMQTTGDTDHTLLQSGASLLFVSLPAVFHQLGGWFGNLVGFVFFMLVFVAALTSCISIIEVLIASVEQKLKIKRKRLISTVIVGCVILISSTIVSYSQNPEWGTGIDLLAVFDNLTVTYIIPVTAFCTCIFIGFVWYINNAAYELTSNGLNRFRLVNAWKIAIKYVCPILVAVIFVLGLIDNSWTNADGSANAASIVALVVAVVSIALSIGVSIVYNRFYAAKDPRLAIFDNHAKMNANFEYANATDVSSNDADIDKSFSVSENNENEESIVTQNIESNSKDE